MSPTLLLLPPPLAPVSAAETSLDELSDAAGSTTEPRRYSGVMLLVSIYYDNVQFSDATCM